MSEGYDNFWDPYCPCKVTRKNVVMTVLAILCFVLVFWTVIITSYETDTDAKPNLTLYSVSSSKTLAEIDFAMSSYAQVPYKPPGASTTEKMSKDERERRKIEDAKAAIIKIHESIQTINRTLVQERMVNGTNTTEPICKCICDLSVTLDHAKESIDYMIRKLEEDMMEWKINGTKCYSHKWDNNPWQCNKEQEEPPAETEDSGA